MRTYEVEDVLALASEADCLIGHEASSLCCAHYMASDSQQYAQNRTGTESFHVPLPHRLVFPLLQNLHSRHSIIPSSSQYVCRFVESFNFELRDLDETYQQCTAG